jgi:hypothetical protein
MLIFANVAFAGEVFDTLIKATKQEKAQKVEFGKAVVEEYINLLQRRADQVRKNDKKHGEFKRRHDLEEIKQLQTEILPKINAGNFDVVVQPAGLIAVETSGRRVALLAPYSAWNKEFRTKVEQRTKGSAYAERVFSTSSVNAKKWKEKNK